MDCSCTVTAAIHKALELKERCDTAAEQRSTHIALWGNRIVLAGAGSAETDPVVTCLFSRL